MYIYKLCIDLSISPSFGFGYNFISIAVFVRRSVDVVDLKMLKKHNRMCSQTHIEAVGTKQMERKEIERKREREKRRGLEWKLIITENRMAVPQYA